MNQNHSWVCCLDLVIPKFGLGMCTHRGSRSRIQPEFWVRNVQAQGTTNSKVQPKFSPNFDSGTAGTGAPSPKFRPGLGRECREAAAPKFSSNFGSGMCRHRGTNSQIPPGIGMESAGKHRGCRCQGIIWPKRANYEYFNYQMITNRKAEFLIKVVALWDAQHLWDLPGNAAQQEPEEVWSSSLARDAERIKIHIKSQILDRAWL